MLPLDQVLIGDCIQVMSNLPEESVDMIFADPPYNLQLQKDLYRPNATKVDGVDEEWDRFDSYEEYDEFTTEWLSASRRLLKKTGTIWVIGSYHNIFRVGKILMDLGFWILNDIVWIKSNPMPQFRGVRFANAHETLIWAQKIKGEKYTFNYHDMKHLNDGIQMRSDWYIPICSGSERIRENGKKVHPTQKPEALLYRVISASTSPGDIILDPFFGTGTTGVVAKRLGRRWIGIERDPHYADVAMSRIQKEVPPLLEAPPVHKPSYRVTFGMLLEQGYIRPGQELVFVRNRSKRAVVLPNGSIRCDELEGSVHQVAQSLGNPGLNGWTGWLVQDEHGNLVLLDDLRKRFLE